MQRRKSITAVALTGLLVGMAGLSFAAVPLFNIFRHVPAARRMFGFSIFYLFAIFALLIADKGLS